MYPCVSFHHYRLPRAAPFVHDNGREFDSVERFYQCHRFLAINERYANDVILTVDAKAVATASGMKRGGSSTMGKEVRVRGEWL